MTDHSFFSAFFSSSPAFICTSDSTVILENKAAEAVFKGRLMGVKLTDKMNASDKFRFEFSLKSKKPRSFTTAATLIFGHSYLCIIPAIVAGKTISVVIATKSLEAAQSFASNNVFVKTSDILELIQNPSISEALALSNTNEFPLFDPDPVVQKLLSDLTADNRFALDFSYTRATSRMNCSDMGLYAFVSYFTMALSALSDITGNGRIDISLYPVGDCFELRLETSTIRPVFGEGFDALSELFPLCNIKLALCDFMAGSSGCTMTVYCKGERIVVSLISAKLDSHIDFKSSDQFANYNTILEEALNSVDAICKEASPASE